MVPTVVRASAKPVSLFHVPAKSPFSEVAAVVAGGATLGGEIVVDATKVEIATAANEVGTAVGDVDGVVTAKVEIAAGAVDIDGAETAKVDAADS
jgi:hypothetical protein